MISGSGSMSLHMQESPGDNGRDYGGDNGGGDRLPTACNSAAAVAAESGATIWNDAVGRILVQSVLPHRMC